MSSSTKFLLPESGDHLYGNTTMIKRLVTEEGVLHWKKYIVAAALMGIVAGCTALVPYLFGKIVDQLQVHRSMEGVMVGAAIMFAVFVAKGIASYGQSTILAKIANRVILSHQRKIFLKLLNENLGFFADRHTAEFVTRGWRFWRTIPLVLKLLEMNQ